LCDVVPSYAVLPVLLLLPVSCSSPLSVHFSRSVEYTPFPEFDDKNCVIENEKICASGLQQKQGMALCLSHSMYSSDVSGAFAKLRKRTIGFVVPVCPSVRMEQLSSPLCLFSWNLVFEHFSKI
jgi:hypothetical protein